MLRTTISRLKRVCAIAFVPRILRGELRYTPGKFEKFTYVIQKTAQKSTKCSKSKSSKTYRRKPPEDPQKYAVSTVCENTLKPEYSDAIVLHKYKVKPIKDIPRNANEVIDPIYKGNSACRCGKCNTTEGCIPCNTAIEGTSSYRFAERQRVIADIFGEPKSMKYERNIPGDLLSNIAHVHMKGDSSNSKLVTDSRIQPNAYNIPDMAKPKPEQKEEVKEDKSLVKDLRTGTNNEPLLMTGEDLMYSNLYDVAPEENKTISPNGQKETKPFWSDVYESAYGENSLYYEPKMAVDTDTINMYKTLKSKNTNYEDTEAGKMNKPYIEKFKTPSEAKHMASSVIKTTTSEQEKEKLTQKIEHIEETPLVENGQSKEDGFNITPKILTNVEKAVNFADDSLDEVAKRCLSSKHKQVDELILREMEKLGIPITGQKNNVILKGNERATSDVFNKSENQKPASEQECEHVGTNISEKTLPEQYLYEFNRTKISEDVIKSDNHERTASLQSPVNPQRYEAFVSSTDKQPENSEIDTTGTKPRSSLTKRQWASELDPKHVLTCNETCPISPRPLIDQGFDCLENTQSIYDHSIIKQKENKRDQSQTVNTIGKRNKYITKSESTKQEPIFEESCKNTDKLNTVDVSLYQSVKAASSTLTAATGKEKSSLKNDPDITASINPEDSKQHLGHEQKEYNQDENESDFEIIDIERIESASEQLQATSEQLMTTSEQLLATSDKLQATSEQLKTSTEILQAASEKVHITNTLDLREPSLEQLNTTSDKLQSSGEKFENLTEDLETTTVKLQNLCENFEQMLLTQMPHPAHNKTNVSNTQQVIPSLLPSVVTSAFDSKGLKTDSSKTPTGNQECDKRNTLSEQTEKPPSTASSSKLASLAQPGATLNPVAKEADDLSSTLGPLPQVNDKTKLSELMKTVKDRNKLIDIKNYLQVQGKKSIPPLSMPMQNTPVKIITPGYPAIKPPMPQAGTPKLPKPKVKCSACDLNTFEIEQHNSHCHQKTLGISDIHENDFLQGIAITEELEPASELKDEISTKLKTLSDVFRSSYQQRKIETLEAIMLARTRYRHRSRFFRSKNFDPWVPIPSWPHSKQKKQSKVQCPKDGCKSFPLTRSENDPPCDLRPCDSFPSFPKRKFSKLDYLAVLLEDNEINELSDF